MSISEELRTRIRIQSQDRCGYCLSRQMYVLGILHIEHIIPKARGGTDEEENLWLACSLCNTYKSAKTHAIDPVTNTRVALFNPRRQNWSEHFTWSEEGIEIIALTPCGRATVIALQLNNRIALTVRQQWVNAGWHPPQ